MLIDTFINAIFLYDDKMVITFNYKEGTKTITFAELQEAISNKNGSDLDCLAAPPSGQALLALILFYNAACQRCIGDYPGKPFIGVLSGTVNMLSIASPTKVLDAVSKCA